MKYLLSLARGIDRVTDRFAVLAYWAVLLSCFISASNAVVRYAVNYSSNGWLEIQWYLFAACVMLGAAQVLRVNEHVRVDIFYGRLGARRQVLVDLLGLVFFLLPVIGVLVVLTWSLFVAKLMSGMAPADSVEALGLLAYLHKLFVSGEMSSNAGGLIRWPAVLMLPLGFALVWLQGLSEIIKRMGWLLNQYDMDTHYERPLQ
jgi:TRAP-type mannitol/chloroaromatic compound transport system permease small subunit